MKLVIVEGCIVTA